MVKRTRAIADDDEDQVSSPRKKAARKSAVEEDDEDDGLFDEDSDDEEEEEEDSGLTYSHDRFQEAAATLSPYLTPSPTGFDASQREQLLSLSPSVQVRIASIENCRKLNALLKRTPQSSWEFKALVAVACVHTVPSTSEEDGKDMNVTKKLFIDKDSDNRVTIANRLLSEEWWGAALGSTSPRSLEYAFVGIVLQFMLKAMVELVARPRVINTLRAKGADWLAVARRAGPRGEQVVNRLNEILPQNATAARQGNGAPPAAVAAAAASQVNGAPPVAAATAASHSNGAPPAVASAAASQSNETSVADGAASGPTRAERNRQRRIDNMQNQRGVTSQTLTASSMSAIAARRASASTSAPVPRRVRVPAPAPAPTSTPTPAAFSIRSTDAVVPPENFEFDEGAATVVTEEVEQTPSTNRKSWSNFMGTAPTAEGRPRGRAYGRDYYGPSDADRDATAKHEDTTEEKKTEGEEKTEDESPKVESEQKAAPTLEDTKTNVDLPPSALAPPNAVAWMKQSLQEALTEHPGGVATSRVSFRSVKPPAREQGQQPNHRNQEFPHQRHQGPPGYQDRQHRGPPPRQMNYGNQDRQHRGPPPRQMNYGNHPQQHRGPPPEMHYGNHSQQHQGPPPHQNRGFEPQTYQGPPPLRDQGGRPQPYDQRPPPQRRAENGGRAVGRGRGRDMTLPAWRTQQQQQEQQQQQPAFQGRGRGRGIDNRPAWQSRGVS